MSYHDDDGFADEADDHGGSAAAAASADVDHDDCDDYNAADVDSTAEYAASYRSLRDCSKIWRSDAPSPKLGAPIIKT